MSPRIRPTACSPSPEEGAQLQLLSDCETLPLAFISDTLGSWRWPWNFLSALGGCQAEWEQRESLAAWSLGCPRAQGFQERTRGFLGCCVPDLGALHTMNVAQSLHGLSPGLGEEPRLGVFAPGLILALPLQVPVGPQFLHSQKGVMICPLPVSWE